MKIVATSDLHGALPEEVPDCDLLVIAGDISPFKNQHLPKEQIQWFEREFCPWLKNLAAPRINLIGGNHDFFLETPEGKEAVENLEEDSDSRLTYLENDWVICETNPGPIMVYGTPYTPNLPRWAFQVYDGELKDAPPRQPFTPAPRWAKDVFDDIPHELDILISHGPPSGYGDKVSLSHTGSTALLEAVERAKPRIMICGHIHEGYGHYRCGETEVYCVSRMTREYHPTNPLVEIEL